ncbi:MAG: DMT family transporter [Succiniclasticum sp.]|jgi:quaternary ammonium compound-resistance protein SugE
MSWFYLFIAGLFEVFWAVFLKLSHGFTQLFYSVLTVAGMVASFGFLSLALRSLPLGTSYAIWTGIGVIGTSVTGVLLFGESLSLPHLACIGLIAAGIVGLRFLGS